MSQKQPESPEYVRSILSRLSVYRPLPNLFLPKDREAKLTQIGVLCQEAGYPSTGREMERVAKVLLRWEGVFAEETWLQLHEEAARKILPKLDKDLKVLRRAPQILRRWSRPPDWIPEDKLPVDALSPLEQCIDAMVQWKKFLKDRAKEAQRRLQPTGKPKTTIDTPTSVDLMAVDGAIRDLFSLFTKEFASAEEKRELGKQGIKLAEIVKAWTTSKKGRKAIRKISRQMEATAFDVLIESRGQAADLTAKIVNIYFDISKKKHQLTKKKILERMRL